MNIYKKPIIFTILATVAISIGTVAMVFIPLIMPSTQPHNSLQTPYTPLELAGRDVYQAEGCNNCHTQTVRPLKAEVARYGPYSKAWEFEHDRPFLWGSKRTGPDLARIGGKYSDKWHYRHYRNPLKIAPQSNMPSYAFLEKIMLDPDRIEKSMKVLGFPYAPEQIKEVAEKNQMDALVAYTQKLGTAVERISPALMINQGDKNPYTDPPAVSKGKNTYEMYCAGCHGLDLKGDVGADLTDTIWLGETGALEDWEIFEIVANGTMEGYVRRAEGGMPPFGEVMGKEKIWGLISYIRSQVPGE
jgi:cytochrome c oxidase cbb3-type subunit 2